MIGVLNAQTMTTSSGCFDDYIYSEESDAVRDDYDDFEDDDKNEQILKMKKKTNTHERNLNAPRTERKRKTSLVVPKR